MLLNGEPFDFPGREATLHSPVTDWDAQMYVLEHVVGAHRQIPESHVFEDIMQLVRWVLDGVPSAVTAEHARHVVDIIESGYRSAATSTGEPAPLCRSTATSSDSSFNVRKNCSRAMMRLPLAITRAASAPAAINVTRDTATFNSGAHRFPPSMPPLASERIDERGLAVVQAWIRGLR